MGEIYFRLRELEARLERDLAIVKDLINSKPSFNNDFKKPCSTCKGKGFVPSVRATDGLLECPKCKGQGFIKS